MLDSNLAALVALLVIIFFGVVLFSVLCCCMKGWVAKGPPAESVSKKGLLRPGEGQADIYGPASVMEEAVTSPISPTPGGGTDNPLWIDQKYKVGILEVLVVSKLRVCTCFKCCYSLMFRPTRSRN